MNNKDRHFGGTPYPMYQPTGASAMPGMPMMPGMGGQVGMPGMPNMPGMGSQVGMPSMPGMGSQGTITQPGPQTPSMTPSSSNDINRLNQEIGVLQRRIDLIDRRINALEQSSAGSMHAYNHDSNYKVV